MSDAQREGEETCQCGKWSFPSAWWDTLPKSQYFELADHAPWRIGGCTHLNDNFPPERNRKLPIVEARWKEKI